MGIKSKRKAIKDVDTLMRGALETRPRFSQLADEIQQLVYIEWLLKRIIGINK